MNKIMRKRCLFLPSFNAVVPELVRAVTQIKGANMSYYRQYFAVIARSMEKHCGFGSTLPLEELSPVWEPLV